MLVMKTIKDPPDYTTGFEVDHYAWLREQCDLNDYNKWQVRNSTHVQITSQVERTEPNGMAVEECSDTGLVHSEDRDSEGHSETDCTRGRTSDTTQDNGNMDAALDSGYDGGDGTTDSVATTTGHEDQEDTSESLGKGDTSIRYNETDDLDIQFIKVITT